MKNDALKSTLAAIAAQAAPSAEIDLWPKLQRHLATSESIQQHGDASMKTISPRTALILLAVIVGFALLFATPPGQAFAQSILQFFIRIEGNSIPATPVPATASLQWVDVPSMLPATATPLPQATSDCADFDHPTCSLEQIRDRVGFAIKAPRDLPAELYFTGAAASAEGVLIVYSANVPNGNPAIAPNNLSVFEERWAGQPLPDSPVAASADVKQVSVGNLPGEYYKGGFYHIKGESVARWNPDLGAETLRWVDGGIVYTLKHSFQDGVYYGQKAFVTLAESMTGQPIAQRLPLSTPTADAQGSWDPRSEFQLSIAQARQQAGFQPSVITKLPKLPAFIGARYDPQRNIVRVLYFFEQTETNTSLLILSQQPAPAAGDCWLCSFWLGNNNHPVDLDRFERVRPPASNLQTVRVGALTGQYVEGFWYKPAQECCYIWQPSPGFKTIRWQKDGMAYELYNMYVTMTRDEMIRVAEGVK